MGDVYQTVPDRVELLPADPPNPSWSFLHTAAFRFCFIYFTLYCLTTQIILSLFPIPIENFDNLDPSQLWPVRTAVFWAAAHVLAQSFPWFIPEAEAATKHLTGSWHFACSSSPPWEPLYGSTSTAGAQITSRSISGSGFSSALPWPHR